MDMIWYGVSLRSIPSIFWETICDIDGAVDNINFPQDEGSMMQLSENWARKRRERHGFATNMGTVLAVDGYVIEIKKPTATDLDGQEVSCYRNRKGFGGLTTQIGCDCNGKVCFVQTVWPGATNDLSCFQETPLFQALRSRTMTEWAHIIADEAYTPLSGECNFQILTPYSQHQLNSAKSQDWQNLQDWLARRKENPLFTGPKPVPQYWKMRSFNHELSSERITIERVLGMMVRRFGMIWRPMEIHFGKVPAVFRVICKLHNICMDILGCKRTHVEYYWMQKPHHLEMMKTYGIPLTSLLGWMTAMINQQMMIFRSGWRTILIIYLIGVEYTPQEIFHNEML